MKIKVLVAVLFSLLFAPAFAQKMNVATYNLRLDTPTDGINQWKNRYASLTQLIRFHGFDIFGTQEGFKHQLEDVKGKLPEYGYIGVGRDDGKEKGEHSAIFYRTDRFSVVKDGTFWLSEVTDRPNKGWDAALPRICTWGLFKDKKTGFEFFVFNNHFDHIGVRARVESTKLIIRKADELGRGKPMIITGDFNTDQNSDSYLSLAKGGKVRDAYDMAEIRYAENGTFNGFNISSDSESRIDHIFLSKPFKVKKYGILTDSYRGKFPSDHFPVMVEVTYK